jgi:hypothetical protein
MVEAQEIPGRLSGGQFFSGLLVLRRWWPDAQPGIVANA